MARRKRRPAAANPLFDHARPRGDGAERDQRLHREDVAADLAERPNEPGSQKLSMLLMAEALRICVAERRAASITRTFSPRSLSDLRLLLDAAALGGRRHRQEEPRHDRQDATRNPGHQGGAAESCGGADRARPDAAVPRTLRRGDRPHHRGLRRRISSRPCSARRSTTTCHFEARDDRSQSPIRLPI